MTYAGRERDALVAKEVMGWTRIDLYNQVRSSSPHGIGYPPGAEFPLELPHYFTDIADAWQVVEKLSELGFVVRIDIALPGLGGRFTVHIAGAGNIAEETAPLAICLAALAAVGVDIEK